MATKNAETKAVFALTERDSKTFWCRVGTGFVNKDGSITLALDALPVSGRLQVRDKEDREDGEERSERGGRNDRRDRR